MASSPAHAPADTLADRLTSIVGTLCRMAAARAGRRWDIASIVLLLWPYLHRLAARFARLASRGRAGGLRTRPPRAQAAPSRPASPRLPQGFAWLLHAVPEAAQLRGQLQALLDSPAMADLLAASPQAGRILRPLCRMLGFAPGELAPALRPPRRGAASVRPPRADPRATASPLPPPTFCSTTV